MGGLFTKMLLGELITGSIGGFLGLLALIQIAPIKINPWTAIGRAIGKSITHDVEEHLKKIDVKLNTLEDRTDRLENALVDFKECRDRDKAVAYRIRILRFADEIYLNVEHSKEHFDQILDDISNYEYYCKQHPEFINNRTVKAVDVIEKTYDKCMEKHTFLQ